MTEINFEKIGESPVKSFLKEHFQDDAFKTFQLAGDASTRRYFRVVHGDNSFVLMIWEPFSNIEDYPFLNIQEKWENLGVPVPSVLDHNSELGLVLLEDLGDLTLERKFWENQNQELVLPYYEKTLKSLSLVHFNTSHQPTYTAEKIAFDVEKFMWEFNYALKYFLQELCDIPLSTDEQKKLNDIFLHICETLTKEERVVCHRDLHSRNLMVKWDKVYFIDFQDARLGPVQYDLVSLLKDSYVDLSQEIQENLLKWYFETFVRANHPCSFEHFHRIYEIQTIQRCFKACGSFASFFCLREDTRYLKYLPKTIRSVKKSLELFPEYAFFNELLEKHGLCEKNFDLD